MRADRVDVTRHVRHVPPGGPARTGGERASAILTIADGDSDRTWHGEAAPLPGFGTDTIDAAEADLRAWVAGAPLAELRSPSARWAVETATGGRDAARAGRTLVEHWALPARPHAITSCAVIDDLDQARAAVAAGFAALKLKLTGRDDRARLAAMRAQFPAIGLRGDCNRCWPAAEVDDRLAELADLGLEYLEEPAPGLGPRLTGPRAVPLALDESLAEPDRDGWLARALASGAVAALVCKPTVLGGLDRCRALQRLAAAHGVDAVWSHALEGPIGWSAVVALAHALGGRRAHGVAPYLREGLP